MEEVYVGIDIGTTATKAVAFNKAGKVIQQVAKEYAIYHPEASWSIQKPHEILEAVLSCIATITKDTSPQLISFSSAMQSVLIVDETGKPLTDAIIWADNRAHSLAEDLKASAQGLHFYQKTGIPIHSFSPMTKIAWFEENDKKAFSKADKF
ncbi:MAG: hypothetical protein KKB19_02120, partial [Bacteroidetes bacterium]|nr:hypothetical protein [Bacteroidota bacterium]